MTDHKNDDFISEQDAYVMKISYSLDEDDIWSLITKSYKLSGKTVRTVSVLLIFTVWFSYVYPLMKQNFSLSLMISIGLILISAIIFTYPLLSMIIHAVKHKSDIKEIMITVYHNLIQIESNGDSANIPFDNKLDIYEDHKYFFLFLNKSNGTLIPKRYLTEPEIQTLREIFSSVITK